MKISNQGIDLIKEFEGFSEVPYKCPAGKDTIGYGHVILNPSPLTKITKETALVLLKKDLVKVESYLNNIIRIRLRQGQFDALVSLVYNWGFKKFRYSEGLKALNQANYTKAAEEFFSKEKGVVNIKGKFSNGLYRRRQEELKLWIL